MTLDGTAYVILGVLGTDPGFLLMAVDYYLSLRPTSAQSARREAHGSMRALALLKPGVSLADARSDSNTIFERPATTGPGPEDDHRAYAEFPNWDWTALHSRRSISPLPSGSVLEW
jgi:hypothetical protein